MDRTQRQRARLQILVDEVGTQERLARKTGTAESYISQLLTSRPGIARKFCERLEKATGKPDGWMDQWLPEEGVGAVGEPPAPAYAIPDRHLDLLRAYRALPSDLRMPIRQLIEVSRSYAQIDKTVAQNNRMEKSSSRFKRKAKQKQKS